MTHSQFDFYLGMTVAEHGFCRAEIWVFEKGKGGSCSLVSYPSKK